MLEALHASLTHPAEQAAEGLTALSHAGGFAEATAESPAFRFLRALGDGACSPLPRPPDEGIEPMASNATITDPTLREELAKSLRLFRRFWKPRSRDRRVIGEHYRLIYRAEQIGRNQQTGQ